MKVDVFWVVASCSMVEVYQRFRGACYLHHQGDETSVNFCQTTRPNNPKTAVFIRDFVRTASEQTAQLLLFTGCRFDILKQRTHDLELFPKRFQWYPKKTEFRFGTRLLSDTVSQGFIQITVCLKVPLKSSCLQLSDKCLKLRILFRNLIYTRKNIKPRRVANHMNSLPTVYSWS
jgi:hypothetical protein